MPLSLTTEGSCTLAFVGWNYSTYFQGDIDFSNTIVNITFSDYESSNALVYYLDDLNGSCNIITTFGGSLTLSNTSITFQGAGVGETFSLECEMGTVYGTFVGKINSIDDLEEGELGWCEGNLYGYAPSVYICAKSLSDTPPSPRPATPEPATATLSLLALAGPASRRRRK